MTGPRFMVFAVGVSFMQAALLGCDEPELRELRRPGNPEARKVTWDMSTAPTPNLVPFGVITTHFTKGGRFIDPEGRERVILDPLDLASVLSCDQRTRDGRSLIDLETEAVLAIWLGDRGHTGNVAEIVRIVRGADVVVELREVRRSETAGDAETPSSLTCALVPRAALAGKKVRFEYVNEVDERGRRLTPVSEPVRYGGHDADEQKG